MNIKETLFEYFDKDHDGHVTVGNIIDYILKVCAVLGVLYCIYRGILDIIAIVSGTFDSNVLSELHHTTGWMGQLFIILILYIIGFGLFLRILDIRIANRELKKHDKVRDRIGGP